MDVSKDWVDAKRTIERWNVSKCENIASKCPRDASKCIVALHWLSPESAFCIPIDYQQEAFEVTVGNCDSSLGRIIEKVLYSLKTDQSCNIRCRLKSCELLEDIQRNVVNPKELHQTLEFIVCEFTIELKKFDEQPDVCETNDEEKLERAKFHKARGVELFKLKCPRSAFYRFSKAVKMLIWMETKTEERRELLAVCHLNLAACQLETGKFELALRNCDLSLKHDNTAIKAYYRRGLAYFKLQEYEKSTDDFQRVLQIEPDNKAALQQLRCIQSKLKEVDEYYKTQMKKMFAPNT